MTTFPLTISSLDGDTFEGKIISISLRGIEGELAILAGHTPFITAVRPCNIIINISESEIKTGKIDGGMLVVSHKEVLLLSGSFTFAK